MINNNFFRTNLITIWKNIELCYIDGDVIHKNDKS